MTASTPSPRTAPPSFWPPNPPTKCWPARNSPNRCSPARRSPTADCSSAAGVRCTVSRKPGSDQSALTKPVVAVPILRERNGPQPVLSGALGQKAPFAQFLDVLRSALHHPLGGVTKKGETCQLRRSAQDGNPVFVVGIELPVQPRDCLFD